MADNIEMVRLEVSVTKDTHELLKCAAEIQCRTMTDFVATVAHEAARRVIVESDVFKLSSADQAYFSDVLLNPPEPSAALQRAFNCHKNLIRSG